MDIKECKIGTRVRCVEDSANVIPSGTLGTIIEDSDEIPFVSWDGYFSTQQTIELGHRNVTAMELHELEVVEKDIVKLTVSVSLEDKEEIAKDILKIVLKDLNVIISDAIESLDDVKREEEGVNVQTIPPSLDFSNEKMQSMLEEVVKDVMKEYMRDTINTLNKETFGI